MAFLEHVIISVHFCHLEVNNFLKSIVKYLAISYPRSCFVASYIHMLLNCYLAAFLKSRFTVQK